MKQVRPRKNTKVNAEGCIDKLVIDSHGADGAILTGDKILHSKEFGEKIGKYLTPDATIYLIACSSAAFPIKNNGHNLKRFIEGLRTKAASKKTNYKVIGYSDNIVVNAKGYVAPEIDTEGSDTVRVKRYKKMAKIVATDHNGKNISLLTFPAPKNAIIKTEGDYHYIDLKKAFYQYDIYK